MVDYYFEFFEKDFMGKKVLIVGDSSSNNSLENFYERAFDSLEYECYYYDFNKQIKNIKLYSKVKYFLRTIIENGSDPICIDLNKAFSYYATKIAPDIIFVFTNSPVLCNSLIYLKSRFPLIKVIYYWADTSLNLVNKFLNAAPYYDLLAVHSDSLRPLFKKLGFSKTSWIPFGVDFIHYVNKIGTNYKYDLGFVGLMSKEREDILSFIIDSFPNLKVAISGDNWIKSKNKSIRSRVIGGNISGTKYAEFFGQCKISLNIISEVSYPSTNMRFFEILPSGSIQLTNFSPEQENIFVEGKDLIYYRNKDELKAKIELIMSLDDSQISEIVENARKKVIEKHTYQHRLDKILKEKFE